MIKGSRIIVICIRNEVFSLPDKVNEADRSQSRRMRENNMRHTAKKGRLGTLIIGKLGKIDFVHNLF
jgi:hypothetical protein